MSVVAITRGGFGSAFQFETYHEAQVHPLIQYGDPVLVDADSLLDEYRVRELPAMLREMGEEGLANSVSGTLERLEFVGKTTRQMVESLRLEHFHTDVWEALLRAAQAPPESAARVLELVRSDREWDLINRKRRSTMAEAKTKEAKAPKEPKEKKEKLVGGFPLNTKLDFGTGKQTTKDKDGKDVVSDATYHPEKFNPKRGGAAERFKKYSKGITIADAIAAGMTAGNVAHDLEKGYVVARTK